MRANPELKNCFLEMIEITNSPLGTLDNGDDTEESIVASIQKTGAVLLEEWSQKKVIRRRRRFRIVLKTDLM